MADDFLNRFFLTSGTFKYLPDGWWAGGIPSLNSHLFDVDGLHYFPDVPVLWIKPNVIKRYRDKKMKNSQKKYLYMGHH